MAKDYSSLTKKVITDKKGNKKTVWVKTGAASPKKKKGGLVSLKDIPNVQSEVNDGDVTYRGSGGEGTRIKVKGKEYTVSSEDFRKLGGIAKIKFKAPFRKER